MTYLLDTTLAGPPEYSLVCRRTCLYPVPFECYRYPVSFQDGIYNPKICDRGCYYSSG